MPSDATRAREAFAVNVPVFFCAIDLLEMVTALTGPVGKRLLVLLEELKAFWVEQGAPIAQALRPGLSDEQIDELMAPTGLILPEEARVWWSWHNGVALEPLPGLGALHFGLGGWDVLSLEQAVAEYWRNRSLLGEPLEPEIAPEMYWHQNWFPLMSFDANCVFFECPSALSTQMPLYMQDHVWEDFQTAQATSLLEAMKFWLNVARGGYYRWDPGLQRWEVEYGEIPLEWRRSGLI